MASHYPRRQFLRSATALGLGAGLASTGALGSILPARAEDLTVGPDAVRFRPEIEPVVRWIEEVQRDQALERAVRELKAGLPYRDLMAGVFLAAIRNIKPRPVGFKFHAVMVVNSAHLIAQAAPAEDQLLPLLWALDNFKGSQIQDIKEGDWTLNRVDEARLPSPGQARAELEGAMEAWDADRADAATAALCRSAGAAGVMEPFWRYGLRDQRNIGHKAIFAMQCWRTLQTIGWPHAEPVLRSLAFGLLDRQGDAGTDSVGPYVANLENARKLREDWTKGRLDAGATTTLLDTLRTASSEDACSQAVKQLNDGVAPESVWDAVTLAASELLIRNPGIVALHAMTSCNALHYIHGASGDDTNRRLALLQAVGWLPLFRERIQNPTPARIDDLPTIEPKGNGPGDIGAIFAESTANPQRAAALLMGYAARGGSIEDVFTGARSMIVRKGRDSHQYKYGAAAWEENRLSSDPKWRAPLAAAALYYVPGSQTPDSPLMSDARQVVAEVLRSRL